MLQFFIKWTNKFFEFRNILEFRNQFFMKFRNGMEQELKLLEWIGIGTDISCSGQLCYAGSLWLGWQASGIHLLWFKCDPNKKIRINFSWTFQNLMGHQARGSLFTSKLHHIGTKTACFVLISNVAI